jgi:hypothetical protein
MSYISQSGVTETLDKLAPAVLAASKVIEDPALPEIACEVLRLNRVVSHQNPGLPCQRRVLTEADKRKGVGLYLAREPLRAYIWARQNPALAIGIGLGVVGIIGAIGYAIGRRRA